MKTFRTFSPRVLSFAVLVVVLFGSVYTTHAATNYKLLETVAGYEAGTSPGSFAQFLQNVFTYLIRIAGIIAVVSLVISGIEYTASGISESRKDDARKRINNVFIGLAGALSAYFILNFINPNLVKFNLEIPQINTRVVEQQGSSTIEGGTVQQISGGSSVTSGTQTTSFTSPDLAENDRIKTLLAQNGITLGYRTPCTSANSTGCVTLAGLPEKAINGLIELKRICGCVVQVNGGSETNGHTNGTKHGPGSAIVDVQKNSEITAFVLQGGNKPFDKTSGSGFDLYHTSLGTFQDERALGHWHIIFN